jgi:hypothetical protein
MGVNLHSSEINGFKGFGIYRFWGHMLITFDLIKIICSYLQALYIS